MLHKLNRHPIELQPPKKKYAPRVESSEEELYQCHPEKQHYSEICYGKIDQPIPTFEQIKPEEEPCQTSPEVEELSTECPDTEEDCDTEEETREEPQEKEEEEDCSNPENSTEESDDCDSCEEDEYRKRSIRLPVNSAKRQTSSKWKF